MNDTKHEITYTIYVDGKHEAVNAAYGAEGDLAELARVDFIHPTHIEVEIVDFDRFTFRAPLAEFGPAAVAEALDKVH